MWDKIKNIIVLLVIGAAIALFLFWGIKSCNKPTPQPKQNTQVEDSLRSELNKSKAIVKQTSDSVKYLKNSLDSVEELQIHAELALNEKAIETIFYKRKYELAKIEKDTSEQLNACDSLVSKINSDSLLLVGYEYLNDSLITTYRKLATTQDSAYTALNNAFFQSELISQKLQEDNKTVLAAYNKLATKDKVKTFWQKIEGGIIAALAVFALLKK